MTAQWLKRLILIMTWKVHVPHTACIHHVSRRSWYYYDDQKHGEGNRKNTASRCNAFLISDFFFHICNSLFLPQQGGTVDAVSEEGLVPSIEGAYGRLSH